MPSLTALSQVAVVVFMFAVGYETEFRPLRGDGKAVPLIAVTSLVVPMGLGMACVLLLRPDFAAIGETHTSRSFVLFMGVAMSITALPVLAAVVRERGLAGTTAGNVATGAAGIMDMLAWLVLAAALIGTGHPGRFPWLEKLLLTGCFVAVMLGAVRWPHQPATVHHPRADNAGCGHCDESVHGSRQRPQAPRRDMAPTRSNLSHGASQVTRSPVKAKR